MHQQLLHIHSLTREIAGLLATGDDDLDDIFSRLTSREAMVETLRKDSTALVASAAPDAVSHDTDVRDLCTTIMKLDKLNMEGIKLTLNRISRSLAELAKEKKIITDLQSISNMGHKQIVDFLY